MTDFERGRLAGIAQAALLADGRDHGDCHDEGCSCDGGEMAKDIRNLITLPATYVVAEREGLKEIARLLQLADQWWAADRIREILGAK